MLCLGIGPGFRMKPRFLRHGEGGQFPLGDQGPPIPASVARLPTSAAEDPRLGAVDRCERLLVQLWILYALVILAYAAFALGRPSHARILEAIRWVESRGRDPVPDGDQGLAIGPFQIHEVYWRDAVEFAPELGPVRGYGYQDCRRRAYAESVVVAYMHRHVPGAWRRRDAEVIARTHNGGPRGAGKPSTEGYWRRVERALATP